MVRYEATPGYGYLVGPYGRQARRDIGRYPYPTFVPELSIIRDAWCTAVVTANRRCGPFRAPFLDRMMEIRNGGELRCGGTSAGVTSALCPNPKTLNPKPQTLILDHASTVHETNFAAQGGSL